MADFDGQSTDRIPIDTNPYTARVLARGSEVITTSAPGGGIDYYLGVATVDLSAYDFSTIIPEAEVYVAFTAGDASTAYAKAPYVVPSPEFTADNRMQFSKLVTYGLQRGNSKSTELSGTAYTLRLFINFYSSSNADSITVHWQIKSTEAAPF